MPGRSLRFAALAFAVSLAPLGAARAAPQEEQLIEVSGTVVVEDGKGGTVDDESGTIVVGVHEGNGARNQRAFLIEGQWKAKVPAGSKLSFEVLALEGGTGEWIVEGETKRPPGKNRMFAEGPRGQGLPIPADRKMAIRARYVAPCRVHVVDAATGAELEHVVVLLDCYHSANRSTSLTGHSLGRDQVHPTKWWKSDFRIQDAPSPVTLTVDSQETFIYWSEELWLHAPGYCWAGVTLDYAAGGESTVKLARGGTLTVDVMSGRLPEQTSLCLRRARAPAAAAVPTDPHEADEDEVGDDEADDPSADEMDSDDEDDDTTNWKSYDWRANDTCLEWPYTPGKPTTFDALPAGDYRLSLEVGERHGKRQTFATANVTMKAGAATSSTLRIENAPKIPDPVPLRGSIRIDPAWGDVDFEVDLDPVQVSPLLPQERLRLDRQELARDPADRDVWKLPERGLSPGSYRITIDAFGLNCVRAVLRAARPIALEVAPPIEATFRFVDAKTKAPLAIDPPSWSLVDPAAFAIEPLEGMHFGGVHFRHGESKSSDTHTFRVPTGRISLSVSAEDYATFEPIVLEVSDEEREFTLPLRHFTGVRVLLRVDGKPIEWESALREGAAPRSKEDFFDDEPIVRSRRPGHEEDEELRGWGTSRGGRYVVVESAGDYTVAPPPLAAFEPVAPRDVTVVDQEFTEVVFELVRKKK